MSKSIDPPVLRITEPGDLIEAVPYLLGFHPRDSVVFVGLDEQRVIVTARADLAEAAEDVMTDETLGMISRGGADRLLAVVYDDDGRTGPPGPGLAHRGLIATIGDIGERHGLVLLEALLVASGRWWSYSCADASCCPPEGTPLPGDASPTAATATFAGLVALPGRGDVEALLTPDDDEVRFGLEPILADCENLAVQAVLDGRVQQHQRAVKRAIFAAARDADRTLFPGATGSVSDEQLCRFAVALTETVIRDAVWIAIDRRRLDGRSLWREMARRLPPPYDAPPLFLFGWSEWRDGNGALAGIAAEAALAADPTYTAADLLLGAVLGGLNPYRTPRLSAPKSA